VTVTVTVGVTADSAMSRRAGSAGATVRNLKDNR
jgi:hypothetical protein